MEGTERRGPVLGGYSVLPVLPEEIEQFEQEMGRLRSGEISRTEFRTFRLQQGVYGQRQPEKHMVRVKLPFGGLTAEALDALGEIAERYSTGKGHVTTRQNIQVHFIDLDRMPEVLRLLAAAGLTSREACGNTVRNVVACPLAGVCAKELFDVTPYAAAYARYFLRNPISQRLPRKFKTAFSGCASDCALTPVNDLGFLAQVRVADGAPQPGFRVVVGGGLSTIPRLGRVLYDFAPPERYLTVSEAVLRVFDRLGERRNRNRARIKFLLDRLGSDRFRGLVEEEMSKPWAASKPDLAALTALEPEETAFLPVASGRALGEGDGRSDAFLRWQATNVVAQKQPGYCAAFVTLPLGDITASQLLALARISRQFAGGRARTTSRQNMVLRWVPEGAIPALYAALAQADLATPGAETISDITSCPGADTCSLAITSPRGLARAISEALPSADGLDPALRKLCIKISGCPNSCGQHQVGSIGLHGSMVHCDGRPVPTYELLLAGGISESGAQLGQRVARVPAKKLPELVRTLLNLYLAERLAGEPFEGWVDRSGIERFAEVAEAFQGVGPIGSDLGSYMDWGATRLFQPERGEGECAA